MLGMGLVLVSSLGLTTIEHGDGVYTVYKQVQVPKASKRVLLVYCQPEDEAFAWGYEVVSGSRRPGAYRIGSVERIGLDRSLSLTQGYKVVWWNLEPRQQYPVRLKVYCRRQHEGE